MKRTTFIAAMLCLLGAGLSCTHDEPNNSDTGTGQRVVEWQDSTLSGDAVMGEKMMFRVGDSLQVIRKPSTRLSTAFDGQNYTLSGDERITIAMKRGSEAEVIKIYKVKDAATGALEYEKDADGNKTEPFYWKSTTETVKLRAWSYGTSEAYTSDPLTTPFTLNTTQTELAVGKDNYRELLYDKQRNYPYAANITLNLYHQLARITVELTNSATSDLSIATNGVTIGGGVLPTSAQFVAPMGDSNIGSWDDLQTNSGTVTARADVANQKYSAVVFPKTYSAGTKIVGVTTTDESPFNSYAYTLPSGGEELEAGKQYSYKVNVRDLVLVSGLAVSDIAAVTYNGSAQTPEPTVTDPESGKVLTKDTHYTLSYTNNTNAGTATCTVTGKGIYSGTQNKNFTINKKDLTNSADFCYAATAITKDYIWELATSTNPLTNTKGVTVTYSSSVADVAAVNSSTGALTPGGTLNTNTTITATVTGSANYTGTATYTIKATSKTKSFSCTRTTQSEKLCKGTYTLQCWGASGGGGTDQSKGSHRGLGGYSYGNYTISNSTATLFVFVGGEGQNATDGGWNGGGATYKGTSGGGMTHISTTNNPSTPLIDASATWNTTGTLIVAGGGGGTDDFADGYSEGDNDGSGGYGGGTSGGEPKIAGNLASGKAGTQTSGYKQGMGQSVPDTAWDDGGGGGGWWGGLWGGRMYMSGGGGGSGYIGGVSTPKETIAGNSSFPAPGGGNETGHGGDGYARITWVSN